MCEAPVAATPKKQRAAAGSVTAAALREKASTLKIFQRRQYLRVLGIPIR